MDNPFRKISEKMIGRSAKYYTLKLKSEIPLMLQIVNFFSAYIFEILTKQVSWGELCIKRSEKRLSHSDTVCTNCKFDL